MACTQTLYWLSTLTYMCKEEITVKRNQQIHLRVTEREKEILEEKARQRGITLSDYIIQSTINEANSNIYSLAFKQAICAVCGLYEIVDMLDIDENLKDRYKRGVIELWRFLK